MQTDVLRDCSIQRVSEDEAYVVDGDWRAPFPYGGLDESVHSIRRGNDWYVVRYASVAAAHRVSGERVSFGFTDTKTKSDAELIAIAHSTLWQLSARRYLERLCKAETRAGVERFTANRSKYRSLERYWREFHRPSQFLLDLVRRLSANDEEGFKALLLVEGRVSALGV